MFRKFILSQVFIPNDAMLARFRNFAKALRGL